MSTTYKDVKLFIEKKVDKGLKKVENYQGKAKELLGLFPDKDIKEECKALTTVIDATKQEINQKQEQIFSKFSELEGIAGETEKLQAALENQQLEQAKKIELLEAAIVEAEKIGYPNLADLEQELEKLNSLAEATQTIISDTVKIKEEIDDYPATLTTPKEEDEEDDDDKSHNNSKNPRDYLDAALKHCSRLKSAIESTLSKVSEFFKGINFRWLKTLSKSKEIIAKSQACCESAATKIQDFFTWKQTKQPTP